MTKELIPYQPTGPLADIGTEINDAHALAMVHAGQAMNNALLCGDLLNKAKATVQHGGWLPWLRQNIAFSDRSAQAYMRLAAKFGTDKRSTVADLSVRRVLQEIATPRSTALEEDLAAWLERSEADKASRPDWKNWSGDDAKACIARIRGFDEIMHRHGICPDRTPDPDGLPTMSECCLICPD